jgi:hypothetical protein
MLYCEECGRTLKPSPVDTTEDIVAVAAQEVPQPVVPYRKLAVTPPELKIRGTAHLNDNSWLMFNFGDGEKTLDVKPARRLIFGRADNTSPLKPDVDLSPYGALEKGVSRHHAVLELKEDTLVLSDAGSSNGTYLNGQRLAPNQPRVLRDGDEVKFGKLVAHIHFK